MGQGETLTPLLHAQEWAVSVSMVGRILTHLKATGQLREPPAPGVTVLRHPVKRPYAVRKPKGYPITQPGDLVQVDTLDLRPLPGLVRLRRNSPPGMCSPPGMS